MLVILAMFYNNSAFCGLTISWVYTITKSCELSKREWHYINDVIFLHNIHDHVNDYPIFLPPINDWQNGPIKHGFCLTWLTD